MWRFYSNTTQNPAILERLHNCEAVQALLTTVKPNLRPNKNSMTMRKLYKQMSLTALLALFVASVAVAQERVVSGSVTDDQGSGMPGVNVLVKGTNTGTATAADGTFRLSVPSDQAVLVISFIGYATK